MGEDEERARVGDAIRRHILPFADRLDKKGRVMRDMRGNETVVIRTICPICLGTSCEAQSYHGEVMWLECLHCHETGFIEEEIPLSLFMRRTQNAKRRLAAEGGA